MVAPGESIQSHSTLSSFSLQESTARESFNIKGNVISSGRKLTRLVPTDGDTRLAIAVKEFPRNGSVGLFDRFNFVKLTFIDNAGKQQQVLANINSIAKRLHLSSSVIRAAAKEGKLDHLLMNAYKETSTLVKSYYSLTANFENYTKTKTGLSQKTILKIVREASKLSNINQGVIIQKSNHKFIAYKENDQVRLVIEQQLLGQGSYGKIYNVFSLHNNETMVLKKAGILGADYGYYNQAEREELQQKYAAAKRDVKNEYDVLAFIHNNKDDGIWGIQDKPIKFVNITQDSENDTIGFIGKKYQGDYFNHLKELRFNFDKASKNKLKIQMLNCHQLLSGLKYLSSNDIFHGDIKPENILVRKYSQSGDCLVHIADLGGAQMLNTNPLQMISFTPVYTSPEDLNQLNAIDQELQEINAAYQGKEDLIQQNVIDQFNNLLVMKKNLTKKMDVFSMGCVLYKTFNPNQGPYSYATFNIPDYEGLNFPNIRGNFNKLPKDVPTEISNLIKAMIDPDPTKRPTAEQAFEQLNILINDKYPKLAEKIQRMQNPK